jgi:transcriptional regulator with XRE-family HTH domain
MPFKRVNVKDEVKKRIEARISQRKIAERSGLKQQVISRIEKEGNSPTLRNFLKYLDAADLKIKIEKKKTDSSTNKYTPV